MKPRVVLGRALVIAAVLLPWAPGSRVATPAVRAQSGEERGWRPSPVHVRLPLVRLGPRLLAYLPHREGPHVLRGSGHTHAAPDHSGIDAAEQQRRLRDLGPAHRHDFLWMTAHDVVIPDPGVPGVTHLFGVEIYAARTEEHDVHPHFVALLPDGALASSPSPPFGVREHAPAVLVERIHRAGGRALLAHPSRYSLPLESMGELPEELWAIEVLSGRTDFTENEAWRDARLSAGHFACVGAGGDIHDEDYQLTTGYQVVTTRSATPSREELREAVTACNFFACGVHSPSYPLIDPPTVEVRGDALSFRTAAIVTRIEAVGAEGRVLAVAEDSNRLDYVPDSDDRYVRFRARRAHGNAVCLSQPVWLIPR